MCSDKTEYYFRYPVYLRCSCNVEKVSIEPAMPGFYGHSRSRSLALGTRAVLAGTKNELHRLNIVR